MHIMTAEGWKMLVPPTVNEVWELVTFDEKKMNYVPVKENGQLRKMGTRPGLAPAHIEGGFYRGPIPSERVCEYVNALKHDKIKYFDDGLRMIPGKDYERTVEVENAVVITHPIKYPPAGFYMTAAGNFAPRQRSKYE